MTCKHGLDTEIVDCKQCETENCARATRINARDTAFPSGILNNGLTKREYFAAMALQGIHASMAEGYSCSDQISAAKAVKLADMLLAELAK